LQIIQVSQFFEFKISFINKTLQKVMDIGPKQIVYISCNPSTQARDAKELAREGYKLKKIALVDQFPHTAHIEAVALFVKKSDAGH
jgi:23S rRNA (uracil1939-C5)-methyltransferase